jgi:HSP90 family molecular chaperone
MIYSVMSEKEFIQALYDEKARQDSNTEDLARSLQLIASDIYTENERFVFELLQNADDAPSSTGTVDIKFTFLKNHLVVSHTGKPFSKDEVKALSSVGESTKASNQEKIGYKGIARPLSIL